MKSARFVNVPDWFAWENHGCGIAAADLNGGGLPDLIVMMVDHPPGRNRGFYRVGKSIDATGAPTTGWGPWIEIPDWFSFENQGAGLAVWDLNGTGRFDLIVFMIDAPAGKNRGFYRIGRSLDDDGNVTGGWGDWIEMSDWFPWHNQHAGIAVGDLDNDGRPELVVFMIDSPPGENQAYYRIGRCLDGEGRVTGGWTDWNTVPDWFSWENQGAGIAIVEGESAGVHDLIVFQIDNAVGQNQAFYRRGTRLQVNGAVGGWEPWMGVPGWFSWQNEGGGIAAATIAGRRKLIVLNVDSPQQQNGGLFQLLDLDADPRREGRWEILPFDPGVLAGHAALLPTGKVLFGIGPGNTAVGLAAPGSGNHGPDVVMSVVWNPAPGSDALSQPATLRAADGNPLDLSSGGDSFLPDGRMLSAGGALGEPFRGRADAAVFNPFSEAWSPIASMHDGRWFPALITMGDGRILAATGLNEAGDGYNQTVELYSVQDDAWERRPLPDGFPGLPLSAHVFLLQDGRVFFSGGRTNDALQLEPCVLDLAQNPIGVTFVPDLLEPVLRNQSASVLLPPAQDQLVLIIGGAAVGKPDKADATGMVSLIDLRVPQPKYVAAPPMLLPRLHLNAVLLPDRTVFVSGGSLKQGDAPLARLQAEIYNPATRMWRPMAAATIPRLYHSTALLLPDGRVVAAGGHAETWEPTNAEDRRIEIFSPPYLFKGPPPTIGPVETEWAYGQSIAVPTSHAADIRWVHLMKNGATTRSFDCGQRLVDLPIGSRDASSLQVSVTDNRNIAPPGWYMLFVVDTKGVPSAAAWVHLA